MNKPALIFVASLLSGYAQAAPPVCLAAAALHAVDYLQTREIARNPAFIERNPILGETPSQAAIATYFLSTGLLLYTACKHNYGGALLQYGWLVVEAGAVTNNIAIGVKISF